MHGVKNVKETEFIIAPYMSQWGHAVARLVEALRYKAGRSRVRFPMFSLEFFIFIIPPAALFPCGQQK
jgi:hypothetical protein